MITFDLACERNHRFEGWFRNREDFDDQLARGLVACPLCGSTRVTKQLSAVAVHVPRRSAAPSPVPQSAETPPPAPEAGPSAPVAPKAFFQALTTFVETHFEDVGPGFAEEARKIESGEAEGRNIRGTTTPAEEEALREDGIDFLKIPLPKYDA